MPLRTVARVSFPLRTLACAVLVAGPLLAGAAEPRPAGTSPRLDSGRPAPVNSGLDAELFYQLFVGELAFSRGEPGVAYQVLLEAAKRTKDEALFRRSVEIAARAGAGEEALNAAKAWRQALPRSLGAAQTQAELLLALNRGNEAVEPLKSLIDAVPAADRNAALASLPRFIPLGINAERSTTAATAVDQVLAPWRTQADSRTTALLATARVWALAGDTPKAMTHLRETLAADPRNEGAGFLAVELMGREPAAEALVKQFLETNPDSLPVRLGYARRLTAAQRYPEALAQTQQATARADAPAAAWLMQGALQIELGQPAAAQAALKRYVAMQEGEAAPAEAPASDNAAAATADEDDNGNATAEGRRQELSQAYLMLAQTAEQQKDYAGAQAWLDKLGTSAEGNQALQRRASLLARQGKLAQARELLRRMPESTADEQRLKFMAEAQLLREQQQWKEADSVLKNANQRLPDDPELLYEQAMVAERLGRFDEMEKLLRKVIQLKPDHQHAYNALGYSLADRGVRLEEARQLVVRALELSPGDPFITDSLGWVEYRMGNRDQAVQLLRQAYAHRPDTEIATHLGEVLWANGQQDEARRIFKLARDREANNDVLRETLKRLKVDL
jgi:tetratricopeptide (TPR) repeat protein